MKNRIFALYITHRAVNQAGVCKIILHATAYFFLWNTTELYIQKMERAYLLMRT